MCSKNTKTDVMIISPIFFSGGSGAAVYYRMLSQALLDEGLNVSVVSDAEQGEFAGRYYGILPARAGRNKSLLYDYVSFAYQNLAYLRLLPIVRKEAPRALLIHSSFFNYPGTFSRILEYTRKSNKKTRFIIDVRDRLMPGRKVSSLNMYDRVIACSENVRRHLEKHGVREGDINIIPVVQNPIEVCQKQIDEVLESYALSKERYILYVGAVKEEKAVDLLLNAFVNNVRPLRPDLSLVIVGLMKTDSSETKGLLQADGVRYLGNLPRSIVLGLMAGASLCVNLSPCEGMPRVSLEALALNKPVVLPPNVPEFLEQCPAFVESSTDPKVVADRMMGILGRQSVPKYPISRHYVAEILPDYLKTMGFLH